MSNPLPQTKRCPTCGRDFANRKKWQQRGIWESIVYCSKRCRTHRAAGPESRP